MLRAATLQRQEERRLASDRTTIQRQVAALGNVAPIQPQTQSPTPVKPTTPSDWVTVMRHRAEVVEGQRLDPRAFGEFQTLQRQVAQTLAHSFRSDRGEPQARYATYGEHLATLQRHALSAPVSRVVLGLVPPAERLPLQRATDEALQRQRVQEQAALNFGTLQTLQRQLAELDAEATQPVLQRIQARRGAGTPLPEAIQRHLEGGLNHDLSRVRIHDDAEADRLAKGVNAVAFTTGTDIFFQAGRFNPNTQSGLELLAHEVTHTVQQSQGRVGTGIDPDAGLEQEARRMGARLAQKPLLPRVKLAPAQPLRAVSTSAVTQRLRIQRQYGGPIVVTAPTNQNLFLGGQGQAWADAGTAAKMAVQALPARLKQQFSDMPSQLLGGILTMLRDTVLILGASTALGAAIGAFFGGVGAIPGATIGFELGQVGLTAWGLGALVHAVASQLNVLTGSVQQFARLSRDAKGNAKTIKAASDALTNGLVIFSNGVILAIGALVLKQGVKAFATTKLGQRVGAQVAGSPTIKWLDARQRMTSTNALGRQVLASGTGNRPNLAMAGSGRAAPTVGNPSSSRPVLSADEPTPTSASPRNAVVAEQPRPANAAQLTAQLQSKYGAASVQALLRTFNGNVVQLTRALHYVGDPLKLKQMLANVGSPSGLLKIINVAQTSKLPAAQVEISLSVLQPVLTKLVLRSEQEVAAALKIAYSEARDMGHALDRHEPDLTDAQLKARITTGIAPDGVRSPTRTSSRFNSYSEMLAAREYALKEAAPRLGIDISKPPNRQSSALILPAMRNGSIMLESQVVELSPLFGGRGIGRGFTASGRPNAQRTWASSNISPISSKITKVQIGLKWDDRLSRWVVGQFFPLP
ncbi:DUF4157 domain-containing protein [Deinococcus sp. 14RED07]|uniref:eCIS core domain-containing protein n=1 Tax=Deinococcus sp. 14RED07 TaxID=2745874 RepID=UPI001E633367